MVGGNGFTNAANFNGYISNFRFIKGTALYTTTFTPPTTPLTAISGTSLLICQSNRFVDNSASPYTITISGSPSVNPLQPFTAPTGTSAYGSGYFDGSGDYLSVADNTALEFGSGDFTVEMWAYYSSTSGTPVLIDKRANTGGYSPFIFYTTGGVVVFYSSSNGSSYDIANGVTIGTIIPNQWNHVAASRSGTSIRLFLNGVLGNTVTSSSALVNNSDAWTLGATPGGNSFNGYLSNARLVKGTAVYTSAFTPPTTPLTAITNTSLLTVQTNAPSQNNTFLDSSTNNFVITRNGNTTQGTFTPYGSNWSGYFGGAGSYMTTPSGSASTIVGTINSSLNLCIECWVYLNEYSGSSSFPALIGNMDPTAESDDWSFGPVSTGALMFYWYDTGQKRASTTSSIPLNTWTHVAVNISTGVITLFINGVSQTLTGTTTLTTGSVGRNYLTFGQWNNGVSGSYGLFKGYVSNLRVIKASTYTANFTPSTAPLTAVANTSLLMFQSNRFIDNSANAFAITVTGSPSVQRFNTFSPTAPYSTSVIGGSGYFDGSGDYLQSPSNSSVSAWSTDFTIEGWFYPTAINSGSNALWTNSTSNSDGMTYGYIRSDGSVALGRVGVNETSSAAGVIKINSWFHIAFVRNGGSVNIYVNGTSVATPSTGNLETTTTKPITIGGQFQSGGADYTFTGYISNFRVVKGSAVYTTNFTPPTSPLTAITDTSLLLSNTNAGIIDNAMMNDLETVGNTQISTSVKKYGTGAMYFDGSGDYLLLPNTPLLDQVGDYTYECWYYRAGAGAGGLDILCLKNVTSMLYIYVDQSSYKFGINQHNVGGFLLGTTVTAVNTWYHVAMCRSGSTVRLFVNGIQEASGTYSSNITGTATTTIGGFTSGGYSMNGYLDDLRVTKAARYTANFTPPTSQVQDQ